MADAGVTVRPYAPADIPALIALMQAMQAHYHVPCPAENLIAADLAALPPGNGILVSEATAQITGFAAWSLQWPGPGLRRGLYLKEIFIAEAARGAGHGRAVMAALAALARTEACARIDFTANAADPKLLAFYASLGATPDPRRLFHRLTGAALDRLADNDR